MDLNKFTKEEFEQIKNCVQTVIILLEEEKIMYGEINKKNYDLPTLETILIKFKMM